MKEFKQKYCAILYRGKLFEGISILDLDSNIKIKSFFTFELK